jgi:arsenate reductase
MILYFNPDCSKCNEALDLLNGAACNVEIRNYLSEPPSVAELHELVSKLGCNVTDIVRSKEPLYIEKFEGKKLTDRELFEAVSQNPVLIERPILISGDKAIVGRPPKLVLDLVRGVSNDGSPRE